MLNKLANSIRTRLSCLVDSVVFCKECRNLHKRCNEQKTSHVVVVLNYN